MEIVSIMSSVNKPIKTRVNMTEKDRLDTLNRITDQCYSRTVVSKCHYFGITVDQYFELAKEFHRGPLGVNKLFGNKNFPIVASNLNGPAINVIIKNTTVSIKSRYHGLNIGTLKLHVNDKNKKFIVYNFLGGVCRPNQIDKILKFIDEIYLNYNQYMHNEHTYYYERI